MRLRIFQPSNLALDADVSKVIGESPAGSFGVLPRHIDMATALVPGILAYETLQGEERFAAVNGGIFVKQGDQVWVATRMAVQGELGELRIVVEKLISEVDEKERKARSAVGKARGQFCETLYRIRKKCLTKKNCAVIFRMRWLHGKNGS